MSGKLENHFFRVPTKFLREFSFKVLKEDSQGGNVIQQLLHHGEDCTLIISREESYPYIINELRGLESFINKNKNNEEKMNLWVEGENEQKGFNLYGERYF